MHSCRDVYFGDNWWTGSVYWRRWMVDHKGVLERGAVDIGSSKIHAMAIPLFWFAFYLINKAMHRSTVF